MILSTIDINTTVCCVNNYIFCYVNFCAISVINRHYTGAPRVDASLLVATTCVHDGCDRRHNAMCGTEAEGKGGGGGQGADRNDK